MLVSSDLELIERLCRDPLVCEHEAEAGVILADEDREEDESRHRFVTLEASELVRTSLPDAAKCCK